MIDELLMTRDELQELTGHQQPRRQLKRLHADGFWRARLVGGRVVMERAHYQAVCQGAVAPDEKARNTARPRVREARP